ncbi:unnamed protein product [Withania somnifera]
MKLSKSILSSNHARHEPPLSLPPSLSRRLKTNGSIKGGQSPATFPTATGKKRGSGFDNPEPSSPKVTCIGQVKMKTKKKRSGVNFRRVEQAAPEERGLLIQNQKGTSTVHFQQQDRNQRWVHLPLTIYEALKEFSCLFPCRSSSFSTNEKEKERKGNGSREVDDNGNRACEDVVARWIVALQDGEGEKMEEMQSSTMRSSRRHVFEGIEFKDIHDEHVELKEGLVEEEKGRVSICVPPKNALLLMRCRSDPMKMTDITNRFWESPIQKVTDEENEGVGELVDAQNFECKVLEEETVDLVENEEHPEAVEFMELKMGSSKEDDKFESSELITETEQQDEVAAQVSSIEQVPESIVDQTTEKIQANRIVEPEKEEESSIHRSSNAECTETENEGKVVAEDAATLEVEEDDDEIFKSTIQKLIKETLLLKDIEEEVVKQTYHKKEEAKSDAAISVSEVECTKESRNQQNKSILPDCLLLMMCEPKLSMEVSKETWVCSSTTTERKQAKKVKNKEVSEESKKSQYFPLQPPRSSCSLPAMSMATMIEQKLLNTMAYEPLVLTRCKSEPMRATAAKLAPETCFWKNRKIEPHRRATFGFGEAAVGF